MMTISFGGLIVTTSVCDPAALATDGKVYPRRGVFARYLSDYMKPHLLSGVVRHEQSRVVAVQRKAVGWLVIAGNGTRLAAVFLSSPPVLRRASLQKNSTKGHPRPIRDPTIADALRTEVHVLVVGAGLTSADVVSTLDQRGHAGPILSPMV
jgi:uncharacterized NAD(P)/FAD-binding protein YdhS